MTLQATLQAELVARDDSLSLYGFASEEERDLFLHLTSVAGIGPKVAIAILSGGPPRELLRAIAAGDALCKRQAIQCGHERFVSLDPQRRVVAEQRRHGADHRGAGVERGG